MNLTFIFLVSLIITIVPLQGMEKQNKPISAPQVPYKPQLSAHAKHELHRKFYNLILDSRITRRIHKSPWKKESKLEELIQQGLSINEEFVSDEVGIETHLHECTQNKDIDNVRFLLQHGAAMSITYAPGNRYSRNLKCKDTPMFWAIFLNDITILKLFFEHKATIELDEKAGLIEAAKTLEKSTAKDIIKLINEHCKKPSADGKKDE